MTAAQVVGVLPDGKRLQWRQRRRVEGADAAVPPVGDDQAVQLREDEDALRLGEAAKRLDAPTGAEIDHLDRVVAESGDEQPPTLRVDRQVIDAAANVGQLDLPLERERRGRWSEPPERTP